MGPLHPHRDRRVAGFAALALTLALALALSPSDAGAATRVSYPALLAQIRSGPVIRAVINRAGGDVEIKFRDGNEWKANFPAGGQPALQRLLHERHIRVIFASRHHPPKRKAATHHHLRYIAAGILGALVLIGAAVLLLRRRRPRAAPESRHPERPAA